MKKTIFDTISNDIKFEVLDYKVVSKDIIKNLADLGIKRGYTINVKTLLDDGKEFEDTIYVYHKNAKQAFMYSSRFNEAIESASFDLSRNKKSFRLTRVFPKIIRKVV